MMKQQAVWRLIGHSLQQNLSVTLLYVLESKGSSPGRKGFLMAVNAAGEMEGSIGGGVMEHKFVELAKEKIRRKEAILSIQQQIHDKSAAKNQSGMICSGEQTILLYAVKPSDAVFIKQILVYLDQHKNGLLRLTPQGLSFENDSEQQDIFSIKSKTDWLYQEQIGYQNHLHIVGAGHCALALSKIMLMLGFYIHLYDDRPELNTFDQNEFVHEKKVVQDYSELSDLTTSNNHYIAVMTAGYRTDDLAIQALLNKQFTYFGVLGSRQKIKKLFAEYLERGVDADMLSKINSPIGIPIKSQTPEEIAVSIAAEIIRVKNAKL